MRVTIDETGIEESLDVYLDDGTRVGCYRIAYLPERERASLEKMIRACLNEQAEAHECSTCSAPLRCADCDFQAQIEESLRLGSEEAEEARKTEKRGGRF